MRGNGLSADAYVAVADLDPGTADALLAALRDRGVAAYAAASPEPVPDGRHRPAVRRRGGGRAGPRADPRGAVRAADDDRTRTRAATPRPAGPAGRAARTTAGHGRRVRRHRRRRSTPRPPRTARGRPPRTYRRTDCRPRPTGTTRSTPAARRRRRRRCRRGRSRAAGCVGDRAGRTCCGRCRCPSRSPSRATCRRPRRRCPRRAWGPGSRGPRCSAARAAVPRRAARLAPRRLDDARRRLAFLGGFVALVARLGDRPDDPTTTAPWSDSPAAAGAARPLRGAGAPSCR